MLVPPCGSVFWRASMPERQSGVEINLLPESASGKDRQFVTALARGLEILRCFNPGERFLGVSELSRRTGLPKPTVSRLAGTLTKLGYLSFSGHYGQYQLAPGVLSLGYAFLSNVDIRQIARPMMQVLAEVVADIDIACHWRPFELGLCRNRTLQRVNRTATKHRITAPDGDNRNGPGLPCWVPSA